MYHIDHCIEKDSFRKIFSETVKLATKKQVTFSKY